MKAKLITSRAAVFVLLTVVGVVALSMAQRRPREDTSPSQPRDADEGTLQWHARRARAKGLQEITIPTPRWRITGAANLDEALNQFSVVLAKPVEEKSFIWSPYNIRTWYKFKVREFLSQRDWPTCDVCPAPPDAPADLLPLKRDEILIVRAGGTAVVDGVRITSVDSAFPPFSRSQEYLLFVKLNRADRVGEISMSHYGVFTVDEGGVRQINNRSHPFAAELTAHGNRVLEFVRAKIAEHRR